MKRKRVYVNGSCCCRSCKRIFDSDRELQDHLSYDGYCHDWADSVIRDFERIILNYREKKMREKVE